MVNDDVLLALKVLGHFRCLPGEIHSVGVPKQVGDSLPLRWKSGCVRSEQKLDVGAGWPGPMQEWRSRVGKYQIAIVDLQILPVVPDVAADPLKEGGIDIVGRDG